MFFLSYTIENLNYIINDYEDKFAENSNKNRMITGDKSLYNIIDKYIGLTGGVGTSENYCSTDFILIDKSNDIIIVNGSTGNSAALICLYDKDKNFIAESSKDGLHPNDYGQKLYARMVVNAIKNYMIDMTIFD